MFFFSKPGRNKIQNILIEASVSAFTYNEVGSTFSEDNVPDGYSVNRYRRLLGLGKRIFDNATKAVSCCAMYNLPLTELHLIRDSDKPEQGSVMAVVARHYRLWTVNPVRIVYKGERYDNEDQLYCLAVGTLAGHVARGEERFTIRFTPENQVYYEHFSFNTPSKYLLKLVYPMMRLGIDQFARGSAEAILKFSEKKEMRRYLNAR